MASEELKTVLELVDRADLGTLTLQERRALMDSVGAPPPEGTQVDPVDANGVPAAGVDVTLEIWAEMPHVWHAFAGLLPEADEAVERIGSWLREDRPTR